MLSLALLYRFEVSVKSFVLLYRMYYTLEGVTNDQKPSTFLSTKLCSRELGARRTTAVLFVSQIPTISSVFSGAQPAFWTTERTMRKQTNIFCSISVNTKF